MPTFEPDNNDPPATSSPKILIPDQLQQQMVLLIVLLAFYCFPILWITFRGVADIYWYKADGKLSSDLVKMMQTVAADPARYTGSIKNLILPVATAITAVNYRSLNISRWGAALFIIPLAGVLACVSNALMFDLKVDQIGSAANATGTPSISSFFVETATSLSSYVMMLVGLKSVANDSGH
ncbi:hypothetical protein EN828_25240 [Mesorhizobium sp. M2D.F.Ca.ET.185.01.1.1]|uniref:hypothetical protein n=1 Tax=unclassified Mesorhizobium TaxID=325217 RepID=UPI000FCC0AC3|nr:MULTISPECIES: hypothetical protein [unclassified Mesorhizobium]TGP74357.1 hypothetical protein EN870_27060 [bacterium M00.F.Ca.ET.227.01.1.1]TGP85043.1 hypothetical protein EN864_27165 [bacterium M00.F.Ca.ET.221.01.1.1]TGP89126.1 hypothetical protein EN865_25590 [bacterium M00.F.Ca.ET.222.01.1.1]TGU12816.1 hypothetical protein EN806_15675 [bacterium M00.F.Ca.ET.163.01.1.1]TGU21281.1 hypothetical protein EN799_53925 [bacterium M00.F.Ca.ET.156.01.1.1]TGU43678.1 hypothetical protein EN789_261